MSEKSKYYEKKIEKTWDRQKRQSVGRVFQKNVRGAVDAPHRKRKSPILKWPPSLVHLRNLHLDRHKDVRISFESHYEEDPNKQALPTDVRPKKGQRKSSALQKRIEVHVGYLENWRRQIARSVKKKVSESYGFLPDERQLAKKKALVVSGRMEKWFYFCQPTNLAFHNLTISKVTPRVLQSMLGVGVNFYPTFLLPKLNIDKSMERFERDLHIRSVFAGSEDLIPLANPKIYVRLT